MVAARRRERIVGRGLRFAVASSIGSALLLGPSAPASACSCGTLTETEALERADAVFVGEVLDVDDSDEFEQPFVVRYSLETDRVYKGSAFERQSLVTPQRGGACGLEMAVGAEWVLYATRPGDVDDSVIDDSELASDLCSLSRPLDGATLAASLGDGEPPMEGASATSGDGDDGGGIPGILFGVGFVVFGAAIAGGGALYTQRRRIRE